MSARPSHSGIDAQALRALIRQMESGGVAAGPVVRLGDARLDAALPWGGLPTGAVHEVAAGDAAVSLAFMLALAGRACRQAQGSARSVLFVSLLSAPFLPHGPGLARFGLMPEQVLLARAPDKAALLWCLEESLRSRAVAAVIGVGVEADLTAARRLQLAAEAGGALGLLHLSARSAPRSAARTRWRIAPCRPVAAPGDVGLAEQAACILTLERCQGAQPGQWVAAWDACAQAFTVRDTVPEHGLRGVA
jgi:protein ImuA